MHDFFCTDPDDMHYKELADKVRYFKKDEEWRPCVRLWKMEHDTSYKGLWTVNFMLNEF